MDGPHTEETDNDIHDRHNCTANEEPLQLLPEAMNPCPANKNQCIGEQEGPNIAMKD
jgi:hypothetical protein